MNQTINILAQGGGDGGTAGTLIMMGLMLVVMWVVLIRPQQKRQKALAAKQAAIKNGDKVITIGGMHATVNAVSDKTVSLRIGDNTFVRYDKSAIATILPKGEKPSDSEKK